VGGALRAERQMRDPGYCRVCGAGLTSWINYYNARRPPDDAYWALEVEKLAADNQHRAYPSRQTIQPDGSTSKLY
jgi:hypothetical protein